jgi:hypothetical protein
VVGEVFWGLHAPLAARLVRRFDLKVAVETGTYFGAGALQLASLCDRVWSIERDGELAEFAQETYAHVGNLTIVQGDSAECMERVLLEVDEPTLFFLDAHWFRLSPRADVALSPQCRVLEELEAIRSCCRHIERSVVMVDDALMFLGALPRPFVRKDFPSIIDVIDRLRGLSPSFHVLVTDDVIIAGPSAVQQVAAGYLQWRDRLGFP